MSAKRDWNIIRPDHCESPEDELPSHLLPIADRLANEAARLTDRYPSGNRPIQRANSMPTWFRIAAAVLVAGVGLCSAAVVWRPALPDELEPTVGPPNVAAVERSRTERWPVDLANQAASSHVRELSFDPVIPTISTKSEVEMLRIQVAAFEQVIRKLQAELSHRELSAAETQRLVESLRQEVGIMRQQLGDQNRPDGQ